MATCPSGHESASDDFCDVCGYAIGAPATLGPGPAAAGVSASGGGADAGLPAEECPRCGARRTGQFCEACGYRFSTAGRGPLPATRLEPVMPPQAMPPQVTPPPEPVGPEPVGPELVWPGPPDPGPPRPGSPGDAAWTAVVTADRAYYDRVRAAGGPDADAIKFPPYCPERRFRLSGAEIRVGRRSAHSGIDPEIDLTGPPADPGVSRLHAVLIRAADGSWSVLDPGSANGTRVNGAELTRDELMPLRDGDRIHLGAWTELVIVREG